jgi:hypothetical protein
MSLNDLMKTGRKFGCTTYTYSVKKVDVVGSENPKIIITARNDLTGALVMDVTTDINSVKENGLPLSGFADIASDKKEL